MDITNDVYESLMHYFETLKHTGYKSYDDVYSLLVYILIEEMLTGDMSFYITEKDYKAINKALYCLYGTCLIPYPTYLKGVEDIRKNTSRKFRMTEDTIIRNTESQSLRLESK